MQSVNEFSSDKIKEKSIEKLKKLNLESYKLLLESSLLSNLIQSTLFSEYISLVSSEDIQEKQVLQAIKDKLNIESEEDFEKWKKENKNLFESNLNNVITQRKLAIILKQYVHKSKARFLRRKKDLDQVNYSLIRIKDQFQANELYLRISEGESSFEEIATKYSKGPEKLSGGVVGTVSLRQGHEKLVSLLSSSKPGEINQPILINDWWLITRLNSLHSAILNKDMEYRMAQEIFNEEIESNVVIISSILEKKFKH